MRIIMHGNRRQNLILDIISVLVYYKYVRVYRDVLLSIRFKMYYFLGQNLYNGITPHKKIH